MKPALKTAALAVALFLFFFQAGAEPRRPQVKAPDEILVKFKKEMTPADAAVFKAINGQEPVSADRAAALIEKKYNLTRTRKYLEYTGYNCYSVGGPSNISVTIRAMKNENMVLNVQPNFYRSALYVPQALPDDPVYQLTFPPVPAVDQFGITSPGQWGFNIIGADTAYNSGLISQLPARQVIVAVIDTGLKTDHPDFAGVTINGRNILNPGGPPDDDDESGGHGTHAAGIIAANTGNGAGIAGTAYCNSSWTAKVLLMPVKILDSSGSGSDADGAAGIMWAADNGAKVINISVGGPDKSDILQEAVNYAYQKGCVIVAAAGNNNGPAWYPAACANVISVAATGKSDTRVSFSNYGKIDVSAPGTDIWSCTNWDTSATTLPAYYSEDGTSFAAPFVSGLAALIMLQNDGIGPDAVRSVIERSAVDIESAGYDIYSGWGRISVSRALNNDYNAPPQVSTYNWPNPFSPGLDLFTNIVFFMPAPAEASVKIYDAGGDLVWEKTLVSAQTVSGNNTVKWDGRNMANKTAANGTYFYVVKTPQLSGRNKIVIIH